VVAGLAAGLGASAAVAGVIGAVVGGAIVGAGTAAVTTVVDNAFAGRTGWDLFHGVGTAMAWGALGGGASALLAGPMQGMSALARYGVQVGVDNVLNTGLSMAQGNFSWDNFGSGLLMSMIVNGVTASPRVRGISEGAMSRGYGAGFEGGIGIRSRMPGAAAPSGPTSIPAGDMEHVVRGDTLGPNSPNAGKWNVRGGGHIPDEIIPRADAEGVPHSTRTTDPVSGISIEDFTRPNGATTPKSEFPPGTTRPQVENMGTEGLNRALTGAPGSSLTPPAAPNANGRFTATVMGPNGHPIIIEGSIARTAPVVLTSQAYSLAQTFAPGPFRCPAAPTSADLAACHCRSTSTRPHRATTEASHDKVSTLHHASRRATTRRSRSDADHR
jgi:hypothetical protein